MAGILNLNVAEENSVVMLGADTSSLVLTLAYFSIFRHPLSEEELLSSAHFFQMPPEVGTVAVQNLINRGILEISGDFICLRGEKALAGVRDEKASRAAQWQQHVKPSVKTLSHIPFLRGLLISGSLSKGTQDVDGDIDFLVLTAANRLWTARFFASFLLRTISTAKIKRYCVNYWLAENQLCVGDHTLFTATEIAFLKPVMNGNLCRAFFRQNQWVKNFYPNWRLPEGPNSTSQRSLRQRALEWLLSGFLGDLFESKVRSVLMKRYKRKIGWDQLDHNSTDARLSPCEIKAHSKERNKEYRKRYDERVDALESELGIQLIRGAWHSKPTRIQDA